MWTWNSDSKFVHVQYVAENGCPNFQGLFTEKVMWNYMWNLRSSEGELTKWYQEYNQVLSAAIEIKIPSSQTLCIHFLT